MATLRSTLRLNDSMSATLNRIDASLNNVLGTFGNVKASLAQPVDTSSIVHASEELDQAASSAREIDEELRKSSRGAQQFANEARNANSQMSMLHSAAIKTAAVIAIIKGIKLGAEMSDELVQVHARLDMINDGQQTTEQLNQMVFRSAQRSRGAYLDTAKAVASLSMQAKDAFADNREAIYFSELLNKMFTISGTSKQGAESVMYNLTQAMASGVLRGQDLNAVMSNTPMILQQVADYLGVSMGEIRKLAAEGELSAQVVKEAVFAAADETEAKFANMPMTFAQVWQSIQNQLIMMFEPALMKLNEFLNDPAIQTAIDAMIIGLGYIAQVIGWLVDAAIWLANVIAENWSWIEPIVLGIAVALGLWAIKSLAVAAANWVSTVAQWALNAALLASPITWIILAIAAIIVAIYQWVKAVGGIRIAWLIVVNAILTAWDWVKIGFFTGVYWVIDLIAKLKFAWASAGVAIAGFIGDMKVSVLMILQNLVNGAINIINGFIDKLNKLPFVSIGFIEQVTFGTMAAAENEAAKQAREADLAAKRAELDADIASRKGELAAMKYNARQATETRLAEIDAARRDLEKESAQEVETVDDFRPTASAQAAKIGNIDKNVGSIKDSLDISNEELKYMREIAERDVINRFTFADMSFDFTNVQSEPDIDGVVDQFSDWLKGQLVGAAEGSHA
ncbi:MAG TPA: tape measure protein [Clostridiaceae bacterium]|nr:tape measure protein [Clostridiaceae bacterium]